MSKVTPPAPAGAERLTVKSNDVVPALPSLSETSLTERLIPVGQGLAAVAVLRGVGAPAVKSVELLSVSVQPPAALKAAVVFESVGAAAPSKKFAPS